MKRHIRITVEGREFTLTRKEARSVVGQIASQMRHVFGAGPGRPRTAQARCACGAMTAKRAKARGHQCVAAGRDWISKDE